jgi:hypothetical protein
MLVVDKSGQRMSEGEKGKAKERLEGEWKGDKPSAVSPQPSAGKADAAIVVAARAKLDSVDASNKAKIEKLVAEFEATSDAATRARVDRELTQLLFELD